MDKYYGIIALIIYLVCLVIFIKHEVNSEDEQEETKTIDSPVMSPLDINDEDATVASLIAAIECRNEYKKNVKVINVRRVG